MVYREGVRKNGLRCVSGGSAFPVSPGAKLPAAFLLPYVATSYSADKPQQKSGLSATFFLRTKKEGKDVPRGSHLEHLML